MVEAYSNGWFPMADSAGDEELYWYAPKHRGVLPLDGFHVPRKLAKFRRHMSWQIKEDYQFQRVVEYCAEATADRPSTWINANLIDLYIQLYECGYAHSVECYDGDILIGGLYGMAIGGAFFGESMFSRRSNASKIALVELVEKLRARGFVLLDTQFVNDHLRQFGVEEITQSDYMERLSHALKVKNTWEKNEY